MIDATGDGRGAEIDRLVEDDLNVSLSLDPKEDRGRVRAVEASRVPDR
jgi:hypothetical protein